MLAPYNNGMRLGQGFNSYTQQICVDDAVVINPERAENILTNDGTTMRILAQKINKASVWRQMKEYIEDGKIADLSTEPTDLSDRKEIENSWSEEDNECLQEAAPEKRHENEKLEKMREVENESKKDGEEKEDADKNAEEEKLNELELNQIKDEKERAKVQLEQEDKKFQAQKVQFQQDIEKQRKGIMDQTAISSDAAVKSLKKNLKGDIEKYKRGTGMGKDSLNPESWPIERARGTSQIVSYSSHFIDNLSEISSDMRLSAALSIKADKFGGSGRGSFIDTDEFINSDIRFYLSVKVINQSINFKDALEFNPIPAVAPENKEEFAKVFGDSFISGFLEGGELNAVVLMNIENKAKLQDIKAEVKVAFTTAQDKKKSAKPPAKDGEPVKPEDSKLLDSKADNKDAQTANETQQKNSKADEKAGEPKKGIQIDAEGNLKLAKLNIAMNTKTTIYVSWCGGAAIKPYDEKWTIDSLLAAAQRFPALVAQFPQRTYALLTNYNSLRSFVKLKPAKVLPITYENAQMYTSTLLDAYMEYKSLYKRLTNDIKEVQTGVKVFKALARIPKSSDVKVKKDEVPISDALKQAGFTQYFSVSLEGLGQARKEIRKQMNLIVKEVDDITRDPSKALTVKDSDWIGPASLETLIPVIEFKARKVRGAPLTNKLLVEEVKSGDVPLASDDNYVAYLFDKDNSVLPLSKQEELEISEIQEISPTLADSTRVTAPVGSEGKGQSFNYLDLNLPDPIITEISVGLRGGYFYCLSVMYENGLTVNYGGSIDDCKKENIQTLSGLGRSEMITSASIEVESTIALGSRLERPSRSDESTGDFDSNKFVIGILLTTNKGKTINALTKRQTGHENEYSKLHQIHQFSKPLRGGYVSGFWGRQTNNEIRRLGLVWTQAPEKKDLFDEDLPIECEIGILTNSKTVLFDRELPGPPSIITGLSSFIPLTTVPKKEVKVEMTAGPVTIQTKKVEEEKEEEEDGFGLVRLMAEPAVERTKEHKETSKEDLIKNERLEDTRECVKIIAQVQNITKQTFSYTSLQEGSRTNWMILPELEDVHIQSGSVVVTCSENTYEEIMPIEFEIPFEKKENIRIFCWLMDFTVMPNSANKDYYIKVGTDGEITPTTFNIKVGDLISFEKPSSESTDQTPRHKFLRANVGWIAYERNVKPGGTITGCNFSAGTSKKTFIARQNKINFESPYESKTDNITFSSPPTQHFIALSEVGGTVTPQNLEISASVKSATDKEALISLQSAPNSTIGIVWVSCL